MIRAVALLTAFVTASESLAIEIIAHRGASHEAPENTLAAVELAWRQEADAVEIDVFLTKDGKIAVIHDENTKKLAGVDRNVVDQTLAELQNLDVGRWKGEKWADERIPTLNDVLKTVPATKRLFIEIKCGPEIVPELKRVLASAETLPEQTVLIGLSRETMRAVKAAVPDRNVLWVVEQERDVRTGAWRPSASDLVREAKQAGLDGLDLGATKGVDANLVSELRRSELSIYVWTVNSAEEARRLQDLGIDGITTDRPGWLRRELAGR